MPLIKTLVSPFLFFFGYLSFLLVRKTPKLSFVSFRHLFVLTNGKSNDFMSTIISLFKPKYIIDKASGLLGELSDSEITKICDKISANGFHSFDIKLNEKTVADLVAFASDTEVRFLKFDEDNITYSEEEIKFDPNNPISPRYQFQNSQLMRNDSVKNIVYDQSILAVANKYLNAKPILDIVTMWWSAPFSKESRDKVAQKYHFDMDRFKFLKFFFYLTDVTEDNGPHCYVKSSHKSKPNTLLEDRRIEDSEIAEHYPPSDILELVSSRGSILAVDTRGFHKGKPLSNGNRLLLQIQFSNALFGAPYNKIEGHSSSPEFQKLSKKFKRTYQLFNG